MKKEYFLRKKRFNPFGRHISQNWSAENMPVVAGSLVQQLLRSLFHEIVSKVKFVEKIRWYKVSSVTFSNFLVHFTVLTFQKASKRLTCSASVILLSDGFY